MRGKFGGADDFDMLEEIAPPFSGAGFAPMPHMNIPGVGNEDDDDDEFGDDNSQSNLEGGKKKQKRRSKNDV